MAPLLANARMYSVTPQAKAAWRTLIEWVIARARFPAQFVDHDPPKLLSELWSRNDLGAVQMCGLPASLRNPAPTILAAPVPSLPRYAGRAIYMSDLAVRANSPFKTVEDTFGGIAGYSLKDSQSGYFAFRYYLQTHHAPARGRYRRIVGNLLNPRGVIKALAAGEIDIGPLDGYVFDLIRDGDPAYAAPVRVLASTDPTPMPPIVATAPLDASSVQRLRDGFMAAGSEPSLAPARATLLIERFVVPELSEYGETRRRAERVEREGEDWP
ncbi:MAG TPA: PhnD/SsuA/transferrin family substrate-binding protein [Burkholderiales bacterium]|nr:PhnD/SsuA/transferrin family substrate-binding protein [Burkholderiales bacterium]